MMSTVLALLDRTCVLNAPLREVLEDCACTVHMCWAGIGGGDVQRRGASMHGDRRKTAGEDTRTIEQDGRVAPRSLIEQKFYHGKVPMRNGKVKGRESLVTA
jgi:hypothetical protein